MKKYILFLMLATTATFITSCDKEDEDVMGDIELTFTATVGAEPLIIFNKEYAYNTNATLRVDKLDYYINGIELIGTDNSVTLGEIDFISFENAIDVTSSEKGVQRMFTQIPAGQFNKIRFSIGVPEAMNAKTNADYPIESVLSKSSHYWAGWESYIFSKVEGQYTAPDGSTSGVSYHTGSNALYRTVELPMSMEVIEGTNKISLNLDVAKLFELPTGWIDLKEFGGTHSDQDLVVATKVVDQYQTAFTVK